MANEIFEPVEGRYYRGIADYPPIDQGTPMGSGDLTKCLTSDDVRYAVSGSTPDTAVLATFYRFDLSALSYIQKLRWGHEGYAVEDEGAGSAYVLICSRVYRSDLTPPVYQWMYNSPNCIHFNPFDTEARADWIVPQDPLFAPFDEKLFDEGMLWLGAFTLGEHYSEPGHTSAQYTDRVWVEISTAGRIRTAHSPAGQRFRVFDDADAGEVSFERLDHPAGSWSTPTQPFGEGSTSPDIECLADGRLRVALIDSDGNLQQYYSSDDGESWA